MSKSGRKSTLSVKNYRLEILNELPGHPGKSSPSPRIKLNALTPSPKLNHRPSLVLKMNRLNEMKFTSLFEKDSGRLFDFKTKPKPHICITELWGTKESYLRKTSYLEAYKELKKAHELEKINKNRAARKIEKPYIEDFQSKIKSLMETKISPSCSQTGLRTIFETKNKNSKVERSGKIDDIINKCISLGKKKKNLAKETKNFKNTVKNFSLSRKKLGRKLSGISKSTSELLINERFSK